MITVITQWIPKTMLHRTVAISFAAIPTLIFAFVMVLTVTSTAFISAESFTIGAIMAVFISICFCALARAGILKLAAQSFLAGLGILFILIISVALIGKFT